MPSDRIDAAQIEALVHRQFACFIFPGLADGTEIPCFALTSPQAGSDAASMRTRAAAGDGGWVLNGQKSWITNAGISKYYTVMAVTDPAAGPRGISAFVVHHDDPGFSLGTPERKLGIHGSPTCSLVFGQNGGCRGWLLGEEQKGMKLMFYMMNAARIDVGLQGLAVAAETLAATVLGAWFFVESTLLLRDRTRAGEQI